MILIFIIFVIVNIIFNIDNLMLSIYNSLYVWFYNIYPSIFIFYNISSYLLNSKLFYRISKIFKLIVRFEHQYSYALLFINIFLGNPGTTSLINEAYENNNISYYDFKKLIKICIFVNPLFILSFFSIKIYLLYLLSLLIYIFIFDKFNKCSNKTIESHQSFVYNFSTFTSSLNNSVYILLNVACFISFFNVFKNTINFMLSIFNINFNIINTILCFSEIASGLVDLDNFYLSIILLFSQGLCILMQSYNIIHKKNISFKRYIFDKIISTFSLTLIFLLFIILFHI